MLSSFMLMSRILCSELRRGTLSASFAFSHLERTMAPNECSVFTLHTQEHLHRQKGRSWCRSDYAFYPLRSSLDLGEREQIGLPEAGNEGTWGRSSSTSQRASGHSPQASVFQGSPGLILLHGSWEVCHRGINAHPKYIMDGLATLTLTIWESQQGDFCAAHICYTGAALLCSSGLSSTQWMLPIGLFNQCLWKTRIYWASTCPQSSAGWDSKRKPSL